jgi:hypothetical protein
MLISQQLRPQGGSRSAQSVEPLKEVFPTNAAEAGKSGQLELFFQLCQMLQIANAECTE